MREIEFRAWVKNHNKMIKVEGLNFEHKYITYKEYEDEDIGYDDKYADFDKIELMQWTGKQDRNSVKIFEGDIIKARFEYETYNGYREDYYLCLVIYDNEWCRYGLEYFCTKNKNYFGFEEALSEDLEVIGNIYENPELLEEL